MISSLVIQRLSQDNVGIPRVYQCFIKNNLFLDTVKAKCRYSRFICALSTVGISAYHCSLGLDKARSKYRYPHFICDLSTVGVDAWPCIIDLGS